MHSQSQPESDERDRTPQSGATPPESPIPSAAPAEAVSDDIRSRLIAAMEEDGMSRTRLASKLGYSQATLSLYMAGKYGADAKGVEAAAHDYLRTRSLLRRTGVKLIRSDTTEAVQGSLERIRKTNDVGVIHGDAGIGKTSGVQLYLADYPTSIAITLTRWARNAEAVEALIFDSIQHGAWKRKTSRGTFIAFALRNSSRLLIVDNAHKATAGALEYLFDLHDETRIPIALVGNREVLLPIEANDQRHSRVGLAQEVLLAKPRALLRHLVNELAPAFAGQVEDLLEKIVRQHGRFRAVVKTLLLATQIHETQGASPVDAIKAAHLNLVRSYALE